MIMGLGFILRGREHQGVVRLKQGRASPRLVHRTVSTIGVVLVDTCNELNDSNKWT